MIPSRPRAFPAHIPGAAPQLLQAAAGGSASTMIACMSVVVLGLGSFYLAQFRVQGKRTATDTKNLADIPTWQLRHAQQHPAAAPAAFVDDPLVYATKTPNFEPRPSEVLPLPGRSIATGGVLAGWLTRVRGKSLETDVDHPRRIAQPAPTNRKNESGRTYTKNSDYVTGFKREKYT